MTILDRYLARTRASAELAAEATHWLPGGDTRSITWFPPHPLFVAEGRGFEVTDADGNRYLDILNNYTSLIHGHAHPAVVEAIVHQATRGTAFAAPHGSQVRLARLLCERVASVESIRFCNSGTEAVMHAVRLARAFTGRPVIAKAEGGYHGSWDGVEVSIEPELEHAGAAARPVAVLESDGLAPGTTDSTVVIPFNDPPAAAEILESIGERLAAVIVEPVAGVAGSVPATGEYLGALREVTQRLGALLVFDEVISLRLAPGGAQSLYGISPDLTTMGKIIGGGLPVGAFGGRSEVMALTDPRRQNGLRHSGTFNANPATMAAGLAALELMTPEEYERLNGLGDRFRDEVNELAAALDLAVTATGIGSLLTIHLVDGSVESYRDRKRADAEAARLFHLALLNEGVFAARRGPCSLSTRMDEREIERVVAAVRSALLAVHAERPISARALATPTPG